VDASDGGDGGADPYITASGDVVDGDAAAAAVGVGDGGGDAAAAAVGVGDAGGDAEITASSKDDESVMARATKSAQKQKRKRAVGDSEDDEVSTDIDDRRVAKVARVANPFCPRQPSRKPTRRSKTWESREKMKKAHNSIDNFVPELPQKTFKNWDEFEAVRRSYEEKYYLRFRVRSSETATKHNR
jgi:hypothetical protein